MTLSSIMMHHHFKFGYKRFCSWGDIIQKNIHWNFEHFWTLTLTTTEQSNLFTRQFSLHWAIKTKFSRKKISSSDDTLESHILITWSFTVTLTLKTANKSFWKTIWLMMLHQHIKFGSKRFSVSENIIWTNIHWHFEILLWPWLWTQQSSFSTKHSGWW